jgi:hypothetical protein
VSMLDVGPDGPGRAGSVSTIAKSSRSAAVVWLL